MADTGFKFMDGGGFNAQGQYQAPTATAPATPSGPTVMTADTLNTGVQPINLPTPQPSPDPSAGLAAYGTSTVKSLDQYMQELTPAPTEADQSQKAILDKIASLTGEAAGRDQAQIDAEKASGAADLKKQLAGVNNELNLANANYEKQFANLGGNGVVETAGLLNAQQAGLRRAQAADVALIAARAQAVQGNLALAQDTANRAVDAKYSTIEDNINIYRAQLEALKPTLNKEERLQAIAQEQKLKAQETKLQEEKAAAKENIGLALTAGITTKYTNKNGQFFDSATGKPFSTPEEFFKAAGVSSFEDAYKKGLVTDFSPQRIEDHQFVAQLAAKYPDAGIIGSDSTEVAQQKLRNSRIYQKATEMTGSGGGSGISVGAAGGDLTDFNVLAGALSTSLGSVTAQKTFEAQWKQAKTDDQKIKVLTAYAKMPPAIKEGVIQNNQVTKALSDVEGLLNKGVQTGLLAAGQSYVANKLGQGGDKQIEEIKSRLVAAVQPYRNKVTGAAWGDQEEAEYQALIGSVKFAPEDLANKISVFKDVLKQQSQTALLSAIDLTGAINNNSPLQNAQQFNTTNRGATETLIGPDGNPYEVPADQVEAFLRDGGHR